MLLGSCIFVVVLGISLVLRRLVDPDRLTHRSAGTWRRNPHTTARPTGFDARARCLLCRDMAEEPSRNRPTDFDIRARARCLLCRDMAEDLLLNLRKFLPPNFFAGLVIIIFLLSISDSLLPPPPLSVRLLHRFVVTIVPPGARVLPEPSPLRLAVVTPFRCRRGARHCSRSELVAGLLCHS